MKTTFRYLILACIIVFLMINSGQINSFGSTYSTKPIPDSSACIFSPDSFVASQLHTKKIVMLGDYTHGASYSLITPVYILREWLKSVIDKHLFNSHLTLVLEKSDEDAKALSSFITEGNYDALLEYTGMAVPVENIEFYSNLRNFSLKIDSVNKALNSNISFKVKGFEWIGFSSDSAFARMTEEQRSRWFINERDTNISLGLIKYVNENPNEEILLFYGNAHLQKGFVQKDIFTYIRDGSKGYFLVHYLKEYFGDKNVLSVNQMSTKQKYGSKFVFSFANKDFYIESKNINPRDSFLVKYDAVIFRPIYKLCMPHYINKILCKKLIEFEIKNLEKLQVIDKRRVNQLLNDQFSDLIFGVHFSNLDEFKSWCSQNMNRLNIDSINSERLGNSVLEILLDKKRNAGGSSVYLQGFGINPDQLTMGQILNWQNKAWPEAFSHIKFFNAVGCYWFGYHEEKTRGKEYLMQFSGREFNEPQKYLEWYRKKYYGYDF